MPFEHRKQPLASRSTFVIRLLTYSAVSFAVLFFSLCIGVAGYHYLGTLGWVDAFLNASMILTGMGPIHSMETTQAKLFASFYALYSGIAFLSFAAILTAPILHRFLHALHLDEENTYTD